MKKKLGLLAVAALSVLVIAGCGKSKDDTTKTSAKGNYDKEITIDVYDDLANYQGIQKGWFAKIVKDKFNMKLNIIAPNVSGGGDTLFQTRSTAGNLGDLIITGADNGRLSKLVKSNLIMDMSQYTKDAKNMKKYQLAIDTMAKSTGKSSGFYAMPTSVSSESPTTNASGNELNYGSYLRWDLYKQLGYPKINTLEDLLPVLKKMQTTMPKSDSGKKTYAFSFFKDWDGNMMNNAKQPTALYGYDELGFVLANADGSDYQGILSSDSQYMRALKLYFKANQMGLVDPESTTQDYDTLFAKYKDGQILYSPWPWLGQTAYNTQAHKAAGKGYEYVPITDNKVFAYGATTEGTKTFMSIGSKAKDPQRIADFIDWLYSPEGIMAGTAQTQGSSGPEGLTWEMKDDEPVLTAFGKKALLDGDATMPKSYGGGSWKDGVSALNVATVLTVDKNPKTKQPYNYTMWPSVLKLNNTTLDKDWSTKLDATTQSDYLEKNDMIAVAPGTTQITPEEESNITTLRGQVKSTIVEYSWKMIFAKDAKEYNSLKAELQKKADGLGYKKVLKVDMKNAKNQNKERIQVVKNYKAEQKK